MSDPAIVACEVRVLYGDTDQMGVVYYANYLRFFEAGRNELCRARGIPYRDVERDGFVLPVIEARVRYLQPAHYDDRLRIETWIPEVGRVRVRFAYRIRRTQDETVLVTGETLHACLNRTGRPARLPAALAAALAAAHGSDGV